MYSITRFGSVTLPVYNTEYGLNPLPADQSGIVAVGAGIYDSSGAERTAFKFPQPITYKCVAYQSTLGSLSTTIDALRALVGQRSFLYRTANDDATVQQCAARLVDIQMPRVRENVYHFEMTLNFMQLGPWQGNSHNDWRFDSGQIFDDGLVLDATDFHVSFSGLSASLTLTNNGNLAVEDAIITVIAGSGTITRVSVAGTGIDWLVDTTVSAGQSLVVDCGARSVQVNGSNAYRGFYLNSAHSVRNWLYLEPGSTTISITLVGTYTGAQVNVAFRDRWA